MKIDFIKKTAIFSVILLGAFQLFVKTVVAGESLPVPENLNYEGIVKKIVEESKNENGGIIRNLKLKLPTKT